MRADGGGRFKSGVESFWCHAHAIFSMIEWIFLTDVVLGRARALQHQSFMSLAILLRLNNAVSQLVLASRATLYEEIWLEVVWPDPAVPSHQASANLPCSWPGFTRVAVMMLMIYVQLNRILGGSNLTDEIWL